MPDSESPSLAFKRRNLWSEVRQGIMAYWRRTTTNPQWLLMAILGRFVVARKIVRHFGAISAECEAIEETECSLFSGLDVEHTLTTLNAEGVCVGVDLPVTIVQKIVQALPEDRPQKTQFGYGAQYVTSKNLLLEYPSLQAEIERIRRDPILLNLAAQYMGTPPIYSGSKMWWSFTVSDCSLASPQPVNHFHYDLYDFRCLRFFFYLTDVDAQSGPHQFVRGSHRQRLLSHALSPLKAWSDNRITDYYGAERVVMIQGAAGTGFAEDPFCFHKGTPPQRHDRLIMMLQYVARDYGVTNNPNDPFAFWKA